MPILSNPSNATRIADIIVPEVFNPYVIQRSVELDAFVQSGIAANNPELDRLASAGGKYINMPYFDDLDGDDEVLSDSIALTPGKITTDQDVAALFMRGRAWAVNDLAKALSGADPMAAIGTLVAGYWVRRRQALLMKMLDGAFQSMAANKLDISANTGDAAVISSSTFVDALQTMGDAKYKIGGVAMHSAAVASLAKQDLIATIKGSNGQTDLKYFMGNGNPGSGYRVFEDDGLPVSSGTYTTYLFGNGAIGYGNGQAPVPSETDRDSLLGDDILINRQHFVYHPRGIKFVGANVAGASPSNDEVALVANWQPVYDPKNIRIIQFKHKIK